MAVEAGDAATSLRQLQREHEAGPHNDHIYDDDHDHPHDDPHDDPRDDGDDVGTDKRHRDRHKHCDQHDRRNTNNGANVQRFSHTAAHIGVTVFRAFCAPRSATSVGDVDLWRRTCHGDPARC